MLNRAIKNRTVIDRNESYEGETIEMKVERITSNKEPIKDGAPLIFTERKDGVLRGYDIRTDRFEVALDATDIVSKSRLTKRDARINEDVNGVESIDTAS